MDTPTRIPPQPPDRSAEDLLRVSEQRLRLLADNAKDVVWSMSPTGDITYVSPAIEKLRGITPEVAMRQTLDEILTPDSQVKVIGYFQAVHAAAASQQALPTFRDDLEYYRADGSTFWTEVFAFPLADAGGNLLEILGVTRDISERKEVEASLQRARDVAERANSAKSRFLAHISHEIRTPMTTLLSWLNVARAQSADGQRELLDKAQDAGQLLLGIINDLLDMSRMEHGSLQIDEEAFALDKVLAQVIDLIRPVCEQKNLQLQTTIDAGVPPLIVGDPLRMTQALLNLASNAVKFTDHGRVHIDIRLLSSDSHSALLKLTVTDSGPGIAPEWQERIFDDLFRVPDTAQGSSGTGLGLAICKRLASLMGGSVGVDSTPGKGSTFWFTARVGIADPHGDGVPAKPVPKPAHVKALRVLLVEDDAPLRDAINYLLKSAGIAVDLAQNGVEALVMLKNGRYDLVLMDLSMPLMGGEECTRRIRGELGMRALPVVGLTAAGFIEDRQRCLDAGMNDYLTKPFDIDDLLAMIAKHAEA